MRMFSLSILPPRRGRGQGIKTERKAIPTSRGITITNDSILDSKNAIVSRLDNDSIIGGGRLINTLICATVGISRRESDSPIWVGGDAGDRGTDYRNCTCNGACI